MKNKLFTAGISSFVMLLIALTVFSSAISAQDLCNSTTAEKGGFTLLTPASGCSPFKVNIQDVSGGTDVVYYYFYKGESISQLAGLTPSTALEETYFATDKTVTFTILQKGKKNGKDMFACKNITVRPNNQPVFAFNACNNSRLEISIPDTIANDFDYYMIDWGTGKINGSQNERIEKNALPYRNVSNYVGNAATKSIKIEGFFNTSSSCASPSYKTIAMNGSGSQPSIVSVEVLAGNKRATVIFEGNFEKNYKLYQRNVSEEFSFANSEGLFKPGKYDFALKGNEQNCFLFFNNSGCQEVTGEVCTVKLDTIVPDGKNNIVGWVSHIPSHNAILGGGLYNAEIKKITERIIKIENGNRTQIENPMSNPYIDLVDCSKSYCYQIETIVEGIRAGSLKIPFTSKSLSAKKCIDRKQLRLPPITDALVTVEGPKKVSILYTDNSGWILKKERFRLLRADKSDSTVVDSTTFVNGFQDTAVATDEQSYCYKINYVDECGSVSENSPAFCSVHLSELSNNLNWTVETPFAGEMVDTYEVIYFDENTGMTVTETITQPPEVSHSPDLSNFEETARYQIKATDANGKTSFSNSIEIPIATTMYVPSAFSPNADGTNDVFKIYGNIKRVATFNLSVYNRWGENVFSSTDPSMGWDGNVNGTRAAAGTYTFKLKAATNSGEIISKAGSVWLMQ